MMSSTESTVHVSPIMNSTLKTYQPSDVHANSPYRGTFKEREADGGWNFSPEFLICCSISKPFLKVIDLKTTAAVSGIFFLCFS